MSKPYQVSLTASTEQRPGLRTSYHFTVGAIEVEGLPLPLDQRAGEIARSRALAQGLVAPEVYAVVRGFR